MAFTRLTDKEMAEAMLVGTNDRPFQIEWPEPGLGSDAAVLAHLRHLFSASAPIRVRPEIWPEIDGELKVIESARELFSCGPELCRAAEAASY